MREQTFRHRRRAIATAVETSADRLAAPFAASLGGVISSSCLPAGRHAAKRQGFAFREESMPNRYATVALAGSLALAACVMAAAQNAQTPGSALAPAARPGLTILEFKPAMDDLMTMLVQPRHVVST
jgi:hypothetical protein